MERPRSVSHTHNDCENERVEKAVPSVMGRFLLIGSDRISAVFRSKGNQPLVFNNYGDGAIAFEHVFVRPAVENTKGSLFQSRMVGSFKNTILLSLDGPGAQGGLHEVCVLQV
jgi:hypothetical protein